MRCEADRRAAWGSQRAASVVAFESLRSRLLIKHRFRSGASITPTSEPNL